MNGSEVETQGRLPQPNPLSLDGPALELTDSEKMDLMAHDDGPYAKAIKKLMRKEVITARNEAMDCDPADEKRQRALMTIAHAMEKFYKSLLNTILIEKTAHLAEVRQKAAEEDLKDQEVLERIILANQT
jgi:hypothetical protein